MFTLKGWPSSWKQFSGDYDRTHSGSFHPQGGGDGQCERCFPFQSNQSISSPALHPSPWVEGSQGESPIASAEAPNSPVTEDVPLTLSPTQRANTDGDSNPEQLGLRKPLRWENYKFWFALITVSSSFQPSTVHQLGCQCLVCGIAKNTTRIENPPNRRWWLTRTE